jgi:alcohol dehydrogenase class IV
VIGGVTGAAHGAICGALLPPVLRENLRISAPDTPARARLDWVIACIAAEFGDLDAFQRWCRDKGLPRLRDLGLGADTDGQIARDAQASSSFAANPVRLSVDSLIAIIADA